MDVSRTFKDTFPIFQGLHSMQKRALSLFLFWFFHNASNFSVSAPFPLQFSLNYHVSIEIQGLSSTDCSFQGLSRCVRTLYQSNIFEMTPSQFLIKKRTSLMKPYQFYLQINKKVRPYLHSLLCRRFFRARECFCSRKRKVDTPKKRRSSFAENPRRRVQRDEHKQTAFAGSKYAYCIHGGRFNS